MEEITSARPSSRPLSYNIARKLHLLGGHCCWPHLLNKAETWKEEATEHLSQLHGLHHVILTDDVLHTNLGTTMLSWGKVVGNFPPGLLGQLRLLLLQQLEPVDGQPQVGLQLGVVGLWSKHGSGGKPLAGPQHDCYQGATYNQAARDTHISHKLLIMDIISSHSWHWLICDMLHHS